MAAASTAGGRTHVVRRGETLSSIARKFGCGNPRVIADANRIQRAALCDPRRPATGGAQLPRLSHCVNARVVRAKEKAAALLPRPAMPSEVIGPQAALVA